MNKNFIIINYFLLASTAFAQTTSSTGLSGFLNNITTNVIGAVVTLFLSLAVVGFFYGIVKFIIASRDGVTESMKEGKQFMLWGLISVFVMFSVWGIIKFSQISLFGNSFDFTKINIPSIDSVKIGNTSGNGATTGFNPTLNNGATTGNNNSATNNGATTGNNSSATNNGATTGNNSTQNNGTCTTTGATCTDSLNATGVCGKLTLGTLGCQTENNGIQTVCDIPRVNGKPAVNDPTYATDVAKCKSDCDIGNGVFDANGWDTNWPSCLQYN
jgi:succinate dehydrogenase/fumarate reductase cytochrome b subunit